MRKENGINRFNEHGSAKTNNGNGKTKIKCKNGEKLKEPRGSMRNSEHTKIRQLKSDMCEYSSSTEYELNVHKKFVHEAVHDKLSEYMCDQCENSTDTVYDKVRDQKCHQYKHLTFTKAA